MNLQIKPLKNAPFGAEVFGIDLSEEISDANYKLLDEAWREHVVLVLHKQAISEDDLIRYSEHFGKLETVVRTDVLSPYSGYVAYMTNNIRDKDGKAIGGLDSAEVDWHSDQAYLSNPATGAIFHGLEVPPNAGKTYFANQYLAYENLSDQVKEMLEGRIANFSYAHRMALYYPDTLKNNAEILAKAPDVLHPVVMKNPVTGRKALYADPSTVTHIIGLSEADNKLALAEIKKQSINPEIVYGHNWKHGDIIMWDNGSSLHKRDTFDESLIRFMKRTTIFLPREQYIVPPFDQNHEGFIAA